MVEEHAPSEPRTVEEAERRLENFNEYLSEGLRIKLPNIKVEPGHRRPLRGTPAKYYTRDTNPKSRTRTIFIHSVTWLRENKYRMHDKVSFTSLYAFLHEYAHYIQDLKRGKSGFREKKKEKEEGANKFAEKYKEQLQEPWKAAIHQGKSLQALISKYKNNIPKRKEAINTALNEPSFWKRLLG